MAATVRKPLQQVRGPLRERHCTAVCSTMGIRHLFTTVYHLQTNGQMDGFNCIILAGLRYYIAEHQRDWFEFTGPLKFAYNTQVHRATGLAPFEVVLYRPPGPAAMGNLPAMEEDMTAAKASHGSYRPFASATSPRPPPAPPSRAIHESSAQSYHTASFGRKSHREGLVVFHYR